MGSNVIVVIDKDGEGELLRIEGFSEERAHDLIARVLPQIIGAGRAVTVTYGEEKTEKRVVAAVR